MLKDNVAKVGDFDAAKILTEEMTEAGRHPRGTRGFAAFDLRYYPCYQVHLICTVPTVMYTLL